MTAAGIPAFQYDCADLLCNVLFDVSGVIMTVY